MLLRLSLAIVFALPLPTAAAVLISEVAWMGSAASPNDEWIELHNDGAAAVSLDGWTLEDSVNLSIPLAGTLGAGQFAVLERTDDDSAPGAAFLTYTGALPNTGATLTLRRADGTMEDRVAGGADWADIGGDNTTKATAQLSPKGWVTGPATPGVANVTEDEQLAVEEGAGDDAAERAPSASASPRSAGSREAGGGSRERRSLSPSDVTLALTIAAPARAYVNQPVEFAARASGLGPTLLASLRYSWNFGDLATASGSSPTHTFRYPGTYVVSVAAAYARHDAVARHELTVLPVAFSLTRNAAGDLQINNDAPYEVDLSGFVLRGATAVTLPPRTVLLPRATLTVPRERLEDGHDSLVALYDAAGVLVASTYEALTPAQAGPRPLTSAASVPVTALAGTSGSAPERTATVSAPSPGTAGFTFTTTGKGSSTTTTSPVAAPAPTARPAPLATGVPSVRPLPPTPLSGLTSRSSGSSGSASSASTPAVGVTCSGVFW